MRQKLGKKFFDRPTVTVAKDLIGKYLVRKIRKKTVAYIITETEAYDGPKDLACHARSGKTKRNAPMFGEPGHAYVYFTYGMHWMLNLVCGKKNYPAAVLIRGLRSAETLRSGEMNGSPTPARRVFAPLDGPAKLTKFLKIDRKLNGKPLSRETGLWVEDRGVKLHSKNIKKTPRIGVSYAGAWAKKPWRFVLKGGVKAADV